MPLQDFFARVAHTTHAWPARRRDLHWHLLPKVTEARDLTERYHTLTHWPGLEPVPAQWLHVTVLHSGPEEDATAEQIQAITSRVREAIAGTGAVKLTFARPTVENTAIECAARPWDAANALWQAAWTATREVMGDRWPLIPTTYYPHTSLAYVGPNTQTLDRNRLKQILSRIDEGEMTLTFPTLSLVSQWHDGRRIVWNHLADVPLTEPAKATAQHLPAEQ